MRLLPFVATIAFFAASGSAFAADCTKGLLWPYTRNPGDCLTDVEIKAGKTGVYTGPVNTNVDVSSIKPDNSSPPSSIGGGGGGASGGYFSGGLLGDLLSSGSSTSSTNAVSCNKGYLWPFLRDPGDCLTATEKLTNKTGVYRGDEVTKVSVSNASAGDAGAANPAASAPPPPASSASSCEKGWFWPFVRESGDCPTGAEKQTNKNGVYRDGEVTQVSAKQAPASEAGAVNPTPASVPAPRVSTAPSCEKGWFWPFVHESGDCPTDANKNNASRGAEVTQVSASNMPAGDAGATSPSANTPPPPSSSAPACQKGLLWPFVRKPGDCPTDTDKK
jgi:hypothetical protein